MFLNVGAHRLFSNSVSVMRVLFIKIPPRIDHDLTQDMAERTDAQDYNVWVQVVSDTGKGNSLCTRDRHSYPTLQGLFPAEGNVFHPPPLGSDGNALPGIKGRLQVSSFLVPSKRSALVTVLVL